jgi:hypothetical protein
MENFLYLVYLRPADKQIIISSSIISLPLASRRIHHPAAALQEMRGEEEALTS